MIAGHGRLLACRELGITEAPTLRLEHLTPAQVRAFAIADNRLTEIATWDDKLLAESLRDLSLLGLDFSIEAIGFEMAEIDLRIASLDKVPDPADGPADAVPECQSALKFDPGSASNRDPIRQSHTCRVQDHAAAGFRHLCRALLL